MIINRTAIINNLINKFNFKTYLEIGVRNVNENFNLINVTNKDSVDPDIKTNAKYKVTSDEFFNNYSNKTYDIIFVDGLHTDEQVYKDIKNSILHLNKNGFIVVHDCNPIEEFHTRSYEEYLNHRGVWNGTVYKGFIKIKKELNDWHCFVINEDHGCGIITQNKTFKMFNNLSYDYNVNNINWKYFNENRKILLDLITYSEFIKLL